MKKLFPLFTMAVLAAMLAACGNDEPDNKQTSISTVYTRSVDNHTGSVHFSQSQCEFTISNNGTLSMCVQMALKVDEATIVDFNTDFMPLTTSGDENYTYTFAAGNVTAGQHTISDIRGKINLFGPTYIQYVVDGQYTCHSTLQPFYSHTQTSINRTVSDEGDNYTSSSIYYGVLINNAGDKGDLYLFNFRTDESGKVFAMLCYEDLTVETTSTGYHLTGSDLIPKSFESSDDTHGTLTEQYRASQIDVTLSGQGQHIAGTITTADESSVEINLSGDFFKTNL